MDIKEILFKLSDADGVGDIRDATDLGYELLSKYVESKKTDTLTIIGYLKGKRDYTLMLDAHIDQIAMVVTNIDENGFLTVNNLGGIDIRMLPSRRVTVHGKQKVTAIFCSTPPHLKTTEIEYTDISSIKLDTALGEKARDIISVGDYVTFSAEPKNLLGSRVTGRSFDNRVSVACMIELAQRLSKEKLPFNVAFILSDSEELGLRGIRPATFKVNPNEAIILDVSFGDGIGISGEESGKLGNGAMIGISPALDKNISRKLISIAEENKIPYQIEAMGAKSGTNADMVAVSREGVRTCTVSIPLRNMHTDVEIVDLKDLDNVCDLIYKYILSGGIMND